MQSIKGRKILVVSFFSAVFFLSYLFDQCFESCLGVAKFSQCLKNRGKKKRENLKVRTRPRFENESTQSEMIIVQIQKLIRKNPENSFGKILNNELYHVKVLPKRFHLNGHTIGFRQQTQKLELHYMSP